MSIDPAARENERHQMVRQQIEGRGIGYYKILQAMRTIPRHCFVPNDQQDLAYSDSALSIAIDATISQPYITALMISLILPDPDDKILEIGTGSGYQTALLASMDSSIYSIDINKQLVIDAQKRLHDLALADTVNFKVADGYDGWPEEAPFDKILISCAVKQLPDPIKDQLKIGGKLVAPIGKSHATQSLTLWTKTSDSTFESDHITDVVFIPMQGKNA